MERIMTVCAAVIAASAVALQPEVLDPKGVALIRDQAQKLRGLVQTDAAQRFLDATESLPGMDPRTAYFHKEQRRWLAAPSFEALPEGERAGFEERTLDEDRYYQTKYGSPLVYVRVIELLAKAGALPAFEGRRIADYGYGTIGHLRLMASLGADVTGIDVDPFLTALYSAPTDTGAIPGAGSSAGGRITLIDGLWPGGAGVAARTGAGFDLFLSKNTLKNGYIHPSRPVEKRLLVDLSVSEEAYVKAVFDALKPGGWFCIYNLSPAPSKEGEPFKHWADGRCPFPRVMLETAGFIVVKFDENDDAAARSLFEALGYPTKSAEGADDLFAHFTLARRP